MEALQGILESLDACPPRGGPKRAPGSRGVNFLMAWWGSRAEARASQRERAGAKKPQPPMPHVTSSGGPAPAQGLGKGLTCRAVRDAADSVERTREARKLPALFVQLRVQ